MKNELSQLYKLTSNNKFEQAIFKLKELYDSSRDPAILNGITSIEGRIKDLKEKDIHGGITPIDNTTIKNQIRQSLISLLELCSQNIEMDTLTKIVINLVSCEKSRVKFSLDSDKGIHKVSELYIKIESLFESRPKDLQRFIKAENFYKIKLLPEIKYYRLLPDTFTNSESSWILKDRDAEDFVILFDLSLRYLAKLAIHAIVIHKPSGKEYRVNSKSFSIEDDSSIYFGERKPVVVADHKLKVSPYLQKLLYNERMWENMEPKHAYLNQNALEEIASLFGIEGDKLLADINQYRGNRWIHRKQELIKNNSKIPSSVLMQFLEVGRKLAKRLSH